jgi:hypothetical protein
MITGIIVVVGIFVGAFTGCVVTMAVSAAAVNQWTEWMMRKVRYWQTEAIRTRQILRGEQPDDDC